MEVILEFNSSEIITDSLKDEIFLSKKMTYFFNWNLSSRLALDKYIANILITSLKELI